MSPGGAPESCGGTVESPCGAAPSIGIAAASAPASSVVWMLEKSLEHCRVPSGCVMQANPSWQSEVSAQVPPCVAELSG